MDNALATAALSRHVQAVNQHLGATLFWPAGTVEGVTNGADQTVTVSFSGASSEVENADAGFFLNQESTVLAAVADFVNRVLPPIGAIVILTNVAGKSAQQRVKHVNEHTDGASAILTLARVAG